MKILVCGSRSFLSKIIVFHELTMYLAQYSDLHIISGGASGPDTYAVQFAHAHNLELTLCLADWDKYGKSAGYRRNIEMLDLKPNLVLAFYDGVSKGTMHTIRTAQQRGIETRIVLDETT